MKSIIKKVSMYFLLYCYLIITFATIPLTSFAQDVVDTSSSQDLLVNPTIVVTQPNVEPDCHTYTGCGLIVVKKHYYLKQKTTRVYHQSGGYGNCDVRFVAGPCW